MASATKLMGLIVDALEEVYQIGAEDMEPAPDFGKGTPTGHIQNMAESQRAGEGAFEYRRNRPGRPCAPAPARAAG